MSIFFKPRFCQTILTCLACLAGPSLCFAADKSGVGPNAISLPKGPGAIEGLGESFQPHLNTGTASSGLALKLPPGTAGHTPALGLSYEGGSGNGPLGFGWGLPIASIQRRSDQGIPTYGENVGFLRADTFINEMREELVPLTNGFLFCKNEGAFIRYQQFSNYWIGTLPNGTRMEFGITPEGRIQDPANTNHVFSWLRQTETDTHGNVIVYSYANFPGSNNLNQKYLASIAYGPGAPPWNNFHFVSFVYEDRPDWFEDCRSGFVVRTGKRLKQIIIGTQGTALTNHLAGDFNGDGLPDYLDRKYLLEYLNYAGANSHWSLLAKVTEVGADGTSTLPPATYEYVVSDPPDTLSAAGHIIGGLNEPTLVMDNPAVDFLDLNGDGLPDVLATDPGGGIHTAYINQGQTSSDSGPAIQWHSGVQLDSLDGRATQFGLQSIAPIAHLADMDGDGLADLTVTTLDGSVLYFQNSGHMLWGTRQEMSIQDSAPPSPFASPDVRTADLDFDKRMDIIQSISTGNGADYRVWFNLGNQTYSAGVIVPQAAGQMLSAPGVQIADFNGDRVPDISRITPAFITVTVGLGYGQFATPITVPIPDWVLDETEVARASLMDINGDGLADLVLERAAPGELWYWLNLGNYTLSRRKVITGLPAAVGANAVIRWADLNGNGTTDLIYADSTASPRMQAVDLGLLINNGAAPNLLIRSANGIGRVTTINYQSSTAYSLADAAAGHPWPDLMPNPVQVVASTLTLDSLGNQYVKQFRYHNGYYDPVEKQFRGFGSAEEIDVGDPSAPTLVTHSFFDTGRTYESMKGKLLALSIEQEDGNVFSVATNLWTIPPVTLYTGTNGTNVSYAHPAGTIKVVSELGQGTPRRLESELAFDIYGNETTNADYGIVENGDRSAFDDERITTTEYALNPNAWIVRHPSRQEIKDEKGAVISRIESYYDDETFSGNNLGSVSVGDLTLVRAWTNAVNPSGYIKSTRKKYDGFGNPIAMLDPLAAAPGGAADLSQGHARQVQYDSRFHTYPVTETIHIGGTNQPLIEQAAYDEGFGTIISSTDFNTNSTTCGYDSFGRIISLVEPYDTPAYPTVAYEYALAIPFGNGGIVNYVETRHRDKTAIVSPASEMYLISRQFTDGLSRGLMVKTEAEPESPGGAPRVVVNGAVRFNAREKASITLNPYFSQLGTDLNSLLAFEDVSAPGWSGLFQSQSNLVVLNLANAAKTTVTFDATLRGIAVTNQDGSFNVTRYEPLLTRLLDENQVDSASGHFGAAMVHYHDGLGRLVRADEIVHLNDDGTSAGSPRTWTTRYEYDLNDQLTQITDAQNNIKVFQSDSLKRKTLMNDPDRGLMTYAYDDASNLRQTRDAKGQVVEFAYDGANRMLSETYLGSPLSPRLGENRGEGPVNVAYHYDTPAGPVATGDGSQSMAQNTRGRLAFVSDGAGEKHISYDARGRTEYEIQRIPDPVFSTLNPQPSTTLVSYRTAFDYDPLDRVTRMTYPDNDQVTFEFNSRDLLQRIGGGPNGSVLSNIVYFPSGQQQRIEFGNRICTSCSFDSRLRLTSLLTAHPSRTTDPLIDLDYTFDAASNLEKITDQRPGSSVPSGDPRRNTQVFAYDDLYRLTRVQYNSANSINYRYDRIGNLLSQNSDIVHLDRGLSLTDLGTLSYGAAAGASNRHGRAANDPPGPHALTSIAGNPPSPAYGYDANGSLMIMDGFTNTWDFKDRLVSCENSEMRADYTYSCEDRRVSKTVSYKTAGNTITNHPPPVTTLYVNQCFEVRDHDAPTKFVFDGATRVARITGSLSTNVRVQRLRFYSGWNLCSLAVTAANALQQLSTSATIEGGLTDAYQWSAASSNWLPLTQSEPLPAGTILWIHAATNLTTSVVGAYNEPASQIIPVGSSLVAGAGFEVWDLRTNVFSEGPTAAQYFDPRSQLWEFRPPQFLDSNSTMPECLAPGHAAFLSAGTPVELRAPDPALRILYYHHDHLGSSSVLTDANGELVEETAFYPFGAERFDYRPRQFEENYKFTQKERDAESGLSYFGARLLASRLARFTRVDPLAADPPSAWLESPQRLNPYSYVVNNPLKFIDPAGKDRQKAEAGEPKPKVLIMYGNTQYQDFAQHSGKSSRAVFEKALKASYQQEGGADAEYVVVEISSKSKEDMEKLFKGSSFDTVVYDGHGSGKGKLLLPEGKLGTITPDELAEWSSLAESKPKKFFFYGCNTAKSGFARDLSEKVSGSEVTGTGNRVAPYYTYGSHPTITEDRDHNITFKGGNEINNVRKIDINSATLPR